MRVKVLNVKSSDEYLEAVVEGEDYTLFAPPLLEYLLRRMEWSRPCTTWITH